MKPFILFTVSGIKATIPDHLEMFFGYMADQAFDEVDSRNCFDDIFIIFMAVVMKSNRIPIIRINSGCGDHRPPKITADILYYGRWITFIRFCIDIKPVFMFRVAGGLYFLE